MAIQPIKMVLMTVASTTSPRTMKPATIKTIPSKRQTQKGGAGRLVTPMGERLSYVVMLSSSISDRANPAPSFTTQTASVVTPSARRTRGGRGATSRPYGDAGDGGDGGGGEQGADAAG